MALCEEDMWQLWVENYVSSFHPIHLAEALYDDSLIGLEVYQQILEQYRYGPNVDSLKSNLVNNLKQHIPLKSIISVLKLKGYENPHMVRRTCTKPSRLAYVHFRAVKRDVHNGRYPNTFHPLRLMASTFKKMLQTETDRVKKQFIADKYIAHLGAEIDAKALKFGKEFVNDAIFEELYNLSEYSTNTLIPQTIFLSRKANAYVINGNFEAAETLFNAALQCATDLMPCLELVYVYYLDVVFKLWKLESNSTKDAKNALQNMAGTGLDLLQYEDDEIRTYLTRQFFIRIVSGLLGIGNNGNIYRNFQVEPEDISEAKRLLKKIRRLWSGIELRQIMFYSVAKAKIFQLEEDISSACKYSSRAVQIAKCAGFSETKPLEQYLVELEFEQYILKKSSARALQVMSMDSTLTWSSLFSGVSSTDQETKSFVKAQSSFSNSAPKYLESNSAGVIDISKEGEYEIIARARRNSDTFEISQSNLAKLCLNNSLDSMTKHVDCTHCEHWGGTKNQVGNRSTFRVNRELETLMLIYSVKSRRGEILVTGNQNHCLSTNMPECLNTYNYEPNHFYEYQNENSRIIRTESNFNQIRTSLESANLYSELDVWELNEIDTSENQLTILSTNGDDFKHDPQCESGREVLRNETASSTFVKTQRQYGCQSDHLQKTSFEGTDYDLCSELDILELLSEIDTSRIQMKSNNRTIFSSSKDVEFKHAPQCESIRDILRCGVLENETLSVLCTFVKKQQEYRCTSGHFHKTSIESPNLCSELDVWELLNEIDTSRIQAKSEHQTAFMSRNSAEFMQDPQYENRRDPICCENETLSTSCTFVKKQHKYKWPSDHSQSNIHVPADIYFANDERYEDDVNEIGSEVSITESSFRGYQIPTCQQDVSSKATCSPLEFPLSTSQHAGQNNNVTPLFLKNSHAGMLTASNIISNSCDVNSLELFGDCFDPSCLIVSGSFLEHFSSDNVFTEEKRLSLGGFLPTKHTDVDIPHDLAFRVSQTDDSLDSILLFGDRENIEEKGESL